MYQGTGTDSSAPCSIFSGKRVSHDDWCSAYNKKS
ncbi:high-potential iron-sulfur protein [Paraburkholderia sediminicola]